MTLNEILDMWDIDSLIDDVHLDNSSISTSKLHSKYLRLLTDTKLRLFKLQSEYNTQRQLKFRYYRGELSRDELIQNNWDQWQFNKPIKAEMEEILTGDADLNQIKLRIQYLETVQSSLESILNQLKSRDWSIKNAIEWKKFISGN